ncbi:hypothetical protein C7S13_5892 [Burkholderia cepacia]|nr:hypothetical protein [Burkholderia cepacia]
MARIAGMSRTLFAQRFWHSMGTTYASPTQYRRQHAERHDRRITAKRSTAFQCTEHTIASSAH